MTMPGADGQPSCGVTEPSMQGCVAQATRRMCAEGTVVIFEVSEDVTAPTRVTLV
jgi:hypothetical protein